MLNSERKFTPFAPRDTNGVPSAPSGFKSVTASKSTESGVATGLVLPSNVASNHPTAVGSNGYTPAGPAKELYLSSTRGREDAVANGHKERSSSLARDTDINVGFSDLPNQIHRKAVKKGFEFTLMVVGESGLGKSTLINSLFLTDIYSSEYPGPTARASKTVSVETSRVLLKERNVNLTLTIVDTPGFGSAVDNSNCWSPLVDFIESRYEEYLNAESRLHRTHITDNRVHCCLYFLFPSGHSLKELDIECMKQLHDKVNIIPIIGKADTLTPEEIATFKKNIMEGIKLHGIKIYEFPDADESSDPSLKNLKARMPFAVVGSNYILESASGERKRGRKYPWGVVEVENLDHCDYLALRNLLIRNYMLDLLDTTNSVHYENYRCRKLNGIGTDKKPKDRDSNKNPLAQMEEEKKEHDTKMKKMEHDMEQVFESKVKEKMQKLLDSEAELQKRHEQTAKALEQQRLELEEKRAALEKEKAAFEMVTREMEDIRRASTMDASSRENLDPKKKKKSLF